MTSAEAGVPSACPRCDEIGVGDSAVCRQCGLRLVCGYCESRYPDPLADRFCMECGDKVVQPGYEPARAAGAAPPASEAPAPDPNAVSAAGLAGRAISSAGQALASLAEAGSRGRDAAAQATLARIDVPTPVRRLARRTLTRSVGELYLELGIALTRDSRFDEAGDAFARALNEGISKINVLDDLALAAKDAGANAHAVRAQLEIALLSPKQARSAVAKAAQLLDADVVRDHGDWLLGEWYAAARREVSDAGTLAECAMLACQAALLVPDQTAALMRVQEAWDAEPAVAKNAARRVLQLDALAVRLQDDAAAGHGLLARLNAVLHRPREALQHVDAALTAGMAEEMPLVELRAAMLEELGRSEAAADVRVDLGRRHDLAARHELAVQQFERAVTLYPDHAVALWYLADSRRYTAERPEFPYVDRETLERALAEWERGTRLQAPAPSESWVHLTGALLVEALARFADDPGRLVQRAALQAERAALLDDVSADSWALLGRYHRMLRHPALAIDAVRGALERDGANSNADFERVLNAIEFGLPDALDGLDDYCARTGRPDDPLLLGLRGHALLLAGRLEEARASLDRSLHADPGDVWLRTRRALCAALMGDEDASHADARLVWADTEPGAPQAVALHGDDRAVAALLRRDFEAASPALAAGLGVIWQNQVELRMGLATASHMRGDADGALAYAELALDDARHRGDIQVVRLYLALLEQWSPDAARTMSPLHERTRALDEQLANRAWTTQDAVDELDRLAADERPGSLPWLLGRVGAARTLASQRRCAEAADRDEELLGFDDPLDGVAEARQRLVQELRGAADAARAAHDHDGVRRFMNRLVELGAATRIDEALAAARVEYAAGHPEAALAEAERAETQASAGADADGLYRARLLAGDALLALGRREEAEQRYAHADSEAGSGGVPPVDRAAIDVRSAVIAAEREDIEASRLALQRAMGTLHPEMGRARAAHTITRECASVIASADEPPALATVFRTLMEDRAVTRAERRGLTAARFAMRRESGTVASLPPLSQITFEAGPGLFADGEGERDRAARRLRDESFRALRERLLQATGVRIPGVELRVNELLGGRRYRLLINEIPYAAGTVPAGGRLAPGARDDEGDQVVNAWSGERATWVAHADSRDDPEALGAHDGIVWLLEGLLRTHMATFVALAEVEYELSRWEDAGGPERSPLLRRAIPGSQARSRFAAVMHRLVREQVPVHELEPILATVARADPWTPIGGLVEAIRIELAGVLPGRHGDRERLEVTREVEAALRAAPRPLSPADASPILQRLQDIVGDRAPGQYVLVVQDAALRALVQYLCGRILPSVAVVTQAETDAARPTGEAVGAA